MSLGDGYEINEVFESAVAIVKNLPKEGPIRPSDELKLKLYAYFKQATQGPNDTARPRFFKIVEAYKWDAWNKLGDMPREEAMLGYIRELKQVMETIPRDEENDGDDKHFEEILGKKFYDYWFQVWHSQGQLTDSQTAASSQQQQQSGTIQQQTIRGNNNNDTQSNSSSGGSSVSLLDDTSQAAAACEVDQGGYKTPTSLTQLEATITSQMSDPFALAVLRLQHGLDETNSRLGRLEDQLKQSIESIRSLTGSGASQQTRPKQLLSQGNTAPSQGRARCGNKLVRFLGQLGTVHWFYLSYPFVVYFIMRLLFERRRRRTDSYPLR